jgi:hypothetical protein
MRGGADQGPCWYYGRLSYRRKFIRTCWLLPGGLLVLALLLIVGLPRFYAEILGLPWDDRWGWWYIGGCAALGTIQTAYTYARWRREVRAVRGRRIVSFHPKHLQTPDGSEAST